MTIKRNEKLDKLLFCPENKVQREAMIWNTILSMLNALQSALLLFVIPRVCGEEASGVFSFAFSVAYLMIMIGNYGVRNYQATDVKVKFGFNEYRYHRYATCILMTVISIGYVLIRGYNTEKALVILLCCLLKVIESVENVYHSEYQRGNRLDVAGKIGTIRFIACIITFVVTLVLSNSMIVAFLAMDIVAIIMLIIPIIYTYPLINISVSKNNADWKQIFIICFPLFLSSFFNIYICNASKYAIDKYSTDVIQGYYGMIFMPVFVINLISNCIYGPHLVRLATYWRDEEMNPLKKYILKQVVLVVGICAAVTVMGYLFGIELMSIYFATDLKSLRITFVVLLIGGGMTAIVDFMNNIITVIRKQKALVWIYGAVSLMALCGTGVMVKKWSVNGAALAYTVVMTIQAIIMVIYVIKVFVDKDKEIELRVE